MIHRDPDSHKGDNGRVMVIGGSALFHGAPILAALAAEYSGVDLVFPIIPPVHEQVARGYSLNFIIQTFCENTLTGKAVKGILALSEKMDAVVIGPGLGADSRTKTAVKSILAHLAVPTVVDASALLYTNFLPKTVVLTPHRGEFKNLTGDEPTPKNVQKWAKSMHATIVVKGPEDIVANKDELSLNKTGNSLMTVGGTGDALSGLIAGLIAQKMHPFDACKLAVKIMGQAGDQLAEKQGSLRAIDLIQAIPELLHKNK